MTDSLREKKIKIKRIIIIKKNGKEEREREKEIERKKKIKK